MPVTILDRLSFQLYSARNFPPLESQLATLAALGYRRVEPYGAMLADVDALAGALAKHRLTAPSCHVGLDALAGDLDGTVQSVKSIGAKLLIAPFLQPDERPGDAAGWRALGGKLADLQATLATHGLRLAWHNHDFEFVRTEDGQVPLLLMFEAAPNLLWQADIGWVARAGEDVAAWLDRHGERIAAIHLKDLAPAGENADEDGWADIGHGTMDRARLAPLLATTSAELFVAEHDNPSDYERFARRSRAAVAAW